MRSLLKTCLVMSATFVVLAQSFALSQTPAAPRTEPAPFRPSLGSAQQPQANMPIQATPVSQNTAANAQGELRSSAINDTTASRPASPVQTPRSAKSTVAPPTKTMDRLPNKAGQVWREYNIAPYTSKITSIQNPQQAILDWVLRETGTDMWFNHPLGVLSADRNRLYVYHTPEIQKVVKTIVDRFVATRGQVQVVDINLITVDNPNWRSHVYSMLQPIEVQSTGIEGWLISKENAARLLGQLSRRVDFKQHSSGRVRAHDGQDFVLQKKQPRQFVRNLRWVSNQYPTYQPLMTTIDEGYMLSISSLSSLDKRVIEATIKCDVDQVERLTTVKVDVPSATPGKLDQMNLQIPQLVNWRFHERIRWPNDQVLLLSCGVVAKPEPQAQTPGNLPRLFGTGSNRAEALLFIEYRGPAVQSRIPTVNSGSPGQPPSGVRQAARPIGN